MAYNAQWKEISVDGHWHTFEPTDHYDGPFYKLEVLEVDAEDWNVHIRASVGDTRAWFWSWIDNASIFDCQPMLDAWVVDLFNALDWESEFAPKGKR
jgi:hypothetical protein